jgi:hypothetical protein
MHRRLFEVREQLNERTDPIGLYAPKPTSAVWKYAECISVIVHRDAELFELVRAFRPSRGLAGRLNCRQQQGNKHSNDGNDDKQFDERKRARGREARRTAI